MSWELSYSLDTSPLVWVDLPNVNRSPGSPLFGADVDFQENNAVHETNFGVRHVYRLFNRTRWTLTIRISEPQLPNWRALHDAVEGELNPFWFRMGTSEMYCRKEAGFRPRQLRLEAQPVLYDYTITLTQEFSVTIF